MSATEQFARSCGYPGNEPSMLAMFEAIRQSGIRRGREMHDERVKLIERMTRDPQMFWGYVNLFRAVPLLSTDEAIRFWTERRDAQIALRKRGDWKADAGEFRMAAERAVVSRYFRRFGARLWQRRAA